MKRFYLSVALALASCALASCAPLPTDLTANLTTQTPAQVSTYAAAEQAATAVTDAADALIKAGALTRTQRATVVHLARTTHAAFVALRADRDAGKPLVFDTINATLNAFRAFRAN
jgi:hypothetical protein